MAIVVIAVGSASLGTFIPLLGAGIIDQVTDDAHKKNDLQGRAFAGHATRSEKSPDAILLPRPLSSSEIDYLNRSDDPMGIAHGNEVFHADLFQQGHVTIRYAQEWVVTLVSDREAPLVVNGMRIKGLKCKPAESRAILIQKFEGGGENNGMLFDVTRSTDTPIIIGDEDKHEWKPFFRYKHIDLGNGATSGDIRLQVTSQTKDCTWKAFVVDYRDAEGQHSQDITNGNANFSVLGLPRSPDQTLTYSLTGDGRASVSEEPANH
ncbi:hypothetical protein ACFV19_33680 [Streptomyces griseoluteus]|uniref:hypothetical protein n=1 Tax=Streptomyces griseoluteus TaxID=29306 RepID=UPI0036738BB9